MADWYLIQSNMQVGPVSESQLASLGLTPETLVWRGMPEWKPAGQVAELAPCFPAIMNPRLPRCRATLPPGRPELRLRTADTELRLSARFPPVERQSSCRCTRHTPRRSRRPLFLPRQGRRRPHHHSAFARHLRHMAGCDARAGHHHAHNGRLAVPAEIRRQSLVHAPVLTAGDRIPAAAVLPLERFLVFLQ